MGTITWKGTDSGTMVTLSFEHTTGIVSLNIADIQLQERRSSYTSEDEIYVHKNLSLHVIDDSIVVLKCIVRFMNSLQIEWNEVHSHANAESFLNCYKNHHNSVIVVDQHMESSGGVLKGTDLCLKLLNMSFKGMIIITTGNTEDVEAIIKQSSQLRNANNVGKIELCQKPLPNRTIIYDIIDSYFTRNKTFVEFH